MVAERRAMEHVCAVLRSKPRRWLITGVAGFIGSNLLETLLQLDQEVVGLDNFSTGYGRNLEEVGRKVTQEKWSRFQFVDGDIRDFTTCRAAVSEIDHVLHQAALGSVPRSLEDPILTNAVNLGGLLNVLQAAREACVGSFVYAASSSTYGDEPSLPKREDRIGRPLSPYAVTKLANELYADVFSRCYGFKSVGLRYFNVFGPRQDPDGAYAAVIPRWISAMLRHDDVVIYGDGETSRDFCYVANAVQANLLAALATGGASGQIYNVALGERTTLNALFGKLKAALGKHQIRYTKDAAYEDFRPGDVRHSQADLAKAARLLGYTPTHSVDEGLAEAMPWYLEFFRHRAVS